MKSKEPQSLFFNELLKFTNNNIRILNILVIEFLFLANSISNLFNFRKFKFLFVVSLCLFNFSNLNAQFYNQHYVAPAPWQYFSNANEIVISTNSTTTVNVDVKKSNGVLVTSLTTIKGNPAVYRFVGNPTSLSYHPLNTVINGAGLNITSTSPVSVNLRNVASDQLGGSADSNNIKGNASLTSFGNAAKGVQFRVGYYRNSDLMNLNGFRKPIYSILAISNGTNISINGVSTVTLNAGQSYLFEAAIGSLVESSLPIVMNTGGKIDAPNGCGDGTLDEMVPVSVLGNEYVVIRGLGNNTAEQTTVVATQANTVLTINIFSETGAFVSTSNHTLVNAGDFYTFNNGNGNSFSASRIIGTKNVAVYSGTASGCEVDIATISPVSQCGGSIFVETYKYRSYDNSNLPYSGYVLLKDSSTAVDFNGVNIETLCGPRHQLGTTGWYVINFNNTQLANPAILSISSTAKLIVAIIQQGGGFSMSAIFSNFTEIPEDPTVLYVAGSQCSNQTAILSTLPGFAPYQWYFNGTLISGATSNTYVATNTGLYSVTSTLACGDSVQSAPVNVVLCSDVSVSKTVNNSSPVIGSNVIFTITATNNGPSSVTGVSVNDILPSGYTYVSSSVPAGTTYNNVSGLWSIGNLNNGQSVSLLITATVNPTGSLTNTANITSSNQPDLNTSNNTSSVTPVRCASQPILSAVTQPTCSTATGSFTITNYDASYTYDVSPSTGVSLSGDTVSAPSGTYTVTATLGVCTSIASSSVVIFNQICAVDDAAGPIVGTTGGDAGINVFDNDILNGNILNPSDVTLTSIPNGPLTVNSDGSVTIAPGTIGGTHTVSYTICENVNLSNCDSAIVTIVVEQAPTVSIGDVTVNEDEGNATVTVTISNPSVVDTVIDITTVSGTAGTLDYTTTTITVTIPAGQTTINVLIPIIDDNLDESDEIFTVEGTVTSGNTANTNPVGTVTIVDNDAAPDITISDAIIIEGGNLEFTITLSNPSSEDIVLTFTYTNNNASDNDYVTTLVTITISAGSTTGLLIIQTINDGLVEEDETFDVSMNVVFGNVGNYSDIGIGIILNDDYAPIANDDGPIQTDMNEEIIISIYDNDSEIPICGTLTVTQPANGTVVVDNNGTPNDPSDDIVTYIPNPDYYGTETFTYQVCDCSGNCSEFATVTINVGTVYPACIVEVFNAVSPDGDGINDVLVIWGLDCHPENTVEIYNRWGVLVYETRGYGSNNNYFRGVSDGRVTVSNGEELPVGTYFYIIKYVDTKDNNTNKQKTGYLYLNR